jgi:hypothetical protein
MNYCDEFEFADTEIDSKSGAVKERARGAFGSLFGGDEEKPKNLDDFKKLFGD